MLPAPGFNIVAPAGTLGCDSTNNFAHDGAHTNANWYDPNNDGPFYGTQGWGLRRHNNTIPDPNAANPDCPAVIPFVFTFDGTTSAFIADKLGQSVIVEYVLVLPNTTRHRLAACSSTEVRVGIHHPAAR